MSTHCRTGTCGNTWSTRCAASAVIRRPPQLGQKALAAERNEPLEGAARAADAREAAGEHAAAEEVAELGGDETRHAVAAVGDGAEEVLEMLAHDGVEHPGLRRARLVRAAGHGRCGSERRAARGGRGRRP